MKKLCSVLMVMSVLLMSKGTNGESILTPEGEETFLANATLSVVVDADYGGLFRLRVNHGDNPNENIMAEHSFIIPSSDQTVYYSHDFAAPSPQWTLGDTMIFLGKYDGTQFPDDITKSVEFIAVP